MNIHEIAKRTGVRPLHVYLIISGKSCRNIPQQKEAVAKAMGKEAYRIGMRKLGKPLDRV